MRVVVAVRRSTVGMTVRASVTVRAALGGKGLMYRRDPCAQVFEHMTDHRIILDQKMVRFDLAGSMPVADVPRKLHKIAACNAQQGLLRCNDLDQVSVVRFQRITMIERRGMRQIHQYVLPVLRLNNLAPQKTVVVAKP